MQKIFILLICVIFTVICYVTYSSVNLLPSSRQQARKDMISIFENVALDQQKNQAKRVVLDLMPSDFELIQNIDAWTVKSPIEIGAGNWIMFIIFSKGNVEKVLIRTMDYGESPPVNAPQDKIHE